MTVARGYLLRVVLCCGGLGKRERARALGMLRLHTWFAAGAEVGCTKNGGSGLSDGASGPVSAC